LYSHSNPGYLNEYLSERLADADSLFEMDDSFLKLLGVSAIYDNTLDEESKPKEKKLLSEESRLRIDGLIMVGNPDKDNIWHWFFQHAWGIDGYVFISRFEDVFLENLKPEKYQPLVEMLSRAGPSAFNNYLYPIINYSFIQI